MDKKKIYPTYFIFGAVVIYSTLFIIPSFMGFYYSFTNWNSYNTNMSFVGLKNFITIFSAKNNYLLYITNTVRFAFFSTLLKTVIGLFLALLLKDKILFKNFHRLLLFAPSIISVLIVGLIFKSVLGPETGILNEFLRSIGLGTLARQWLGDLSVVFNTVIAVDTWRGMGYIMVIFLAGLQSIPDSYYEASEIDGANYFNKLIHITLPLMRQSMAVVIVINILHGLRVFDIIYVLTNGGPGYATSVMYTGVLKEFSYGTYAVGSALSTVMFIFMAAVSYFVIRLLTKKAVEL